MSGEEYYGFKINPRFVQYFKSLEAAAVEYKNLRAQADSSIEKRNDPVFMQMLNEAAEARKKEEEFFCNQSGIIKDMSTGPITENKSKESAEAIGEEVERYMDKVKSWYA